MTKYNTIYADPPWTFSTYSPKGLGRSSEAYYDCMSLDEIKSLPVLDFAAPDCVLLLWITDPMLDKAFDVINAWGFTYKTVGFYWAKLNKDRIFGYIEDDHNWAIGTGYWTRACPEQCLLATRGKPHRIHADVRKLIVAPRREHSRKPDEAYERIERLCTGPYLELFARYQRDGWDTAFSTMEGSVERRWKSNESPVASDDGEVAVPKIDIMSFV